MFKATIVTNRLCSPIGPNSLFRFGIFFWNFAMDKNWAWTFHTISTNSFEIKNFKIIQFWTIFFAFHSRYIEIQKTVCFLQVVNGFKIFESFTIKVFFVRLSKNSVCDHSSRQVQNLASGKKWEGVGVVGQKWPPNPELRFVTYCKWRSYQKDTSHNHLKESMNRHKNRKPNVLFRKGHSDVGDIMSLVAFSLGDNFQMLLKNMVLIFVLVTQLVSNICHQHRFSQFKNKTRKSRIIKASRASSWIKHGHVKSLEQEN